MEKITCVQDNLPGNPINTMENYLELRKFRKVADYKMSIQKAIGFYQQ